jgi:hypothetical protein
MPEGRKTSVVRESFQQVDFEHVPIPAQIFEDAGLHHHESAIDPGIAFAAFLGKTSKLVSKGEIAEPPQRRHCGDGRELTLRAVIGQEAVEQQIRDMSP